VRCISRAVQGENHEAQRTNIIVDEKFCLVSHLIVGNIVQGKFRILLMSAGKVLHCKTLSRWRDVLCPSVP
jgi:hypothetical protein